MLGIEAPDAMRKEMTNAERRLWRAIRTRLPLEGTHFRRQVPIGPFIADFICYSARVVIEVDGSQHAESTSDARRAGRYPAARATAASATVAPANVAGSEGVIP